MDDFDGGYGGVPLVATLAWDRGVVTVRGTPRDRTFWRDLHAVVGIAASAVILFLALTGMPWSMFWGDHFQEWATNAHLGRPEAPAPSMPMWMMSATMPNMPHSPHSADGVPPEGKPWATAKVPAPVSTIQGIAPITIDQAVSRFAELGVDRATTIALPEGPKGAYVATMNTARAEGTRAIYLDQYSGALLGNQSFHQWGPVSKAVEWGIAVHQGTEYGQLNRIIMLLGCAAILMLAASSVTMWLKRRVRGRWGVPPPADPWRARGFLGITIAAGVLFPLVGVSLIVAWMLDRAASIAGRSAGVAS